jgi:hypothetical protein
MLLHSEHRSGPHAIADGQDALVARLLGKGVSVELSDDWTGLEDVNARNRNSWFPLLPKPEGAPGMWMAGRDRDGDVVATQGAVLLDCAERSFGERLADLSAFHDPGAAPSAEWCFCASEAAYARRGRVAFVVAGWVRPDWRGRGIFHPMAHLMRLRAWSRWDVHHWVGLVDADIVPHWNARSAGSRLLERRPSIVYHQEGVGRLPLRLLSFTRAGVAMDAAGLLAARRVA